MGGHGLDECGSELGQAVCCNHGNQCLDSIKCGE
jgi:hypothetical protein